MEGTDTIPLRRMPMDTSIRAGMVARGMHRHRMCTMVIANHHRMCTTAIARHHYPWCATTGVPGPTMHGSRAHAFHRITAERAMWCMTGAATGCTSHHMAITGCSTAVTTCWWRLPRA